MRSPPDRWLRIWVVTVAVTIASVLAAGSCPARQDARTRMLRTDARSPRLRVAIVRDAPSVEIATSGRVGLLVEGEGGTRLPGRAPPRASVTARDGKVVWGDRPLHVSAVRLEPEGDGSVRVDGRAYRGAVGVRAHGDATVLCINEVDLESYLVGVLGAEMPASWPEEALEAQAIAARTYALDRARRRRRAAYDLTADTGSQVYRGLEAEAERTVRAVDRTRAVILVHDGKIFTPFYMSTCGGHTASAAKVFGLEDAPPLSGVPCGHCDASPRSRWPGGDESVFFREEEIVTALRGEGLPFDRVDRIEPLGGEPDGYAARVSLHSGDDVFTVTGLRFRMALGPNRLPSVRFEVSREGDGFAFRGEGWGHGVGLCQWGARGMALSGFGPREILAHYYPGSDLVRVR